MTDDLFTGADQSTETTPEVKIDDLVGEGKKFKTVEDLAKGKLEADRFIEKLTREQAELRNELNTRIGLTEFLDQIKNSTTQQNQPSGDNQVRNGGENATALTPEQIEELLDRKLTAKEQARIASENLKVTKQKLAEAFGPNYVNKLNEEANNLGLSKEYMNNLAATAPQALFKLLGVDNRAQPQDLFTPPSNGFRTPTANAPVERTQSWYDQLKAKDPKQYWDAKTQVQLHKDAIRLGERFFT